MTQPAYLDAVDAVQTAIAEICKAIVPNTQVYFALTPPAGDRYWTVAFTRTAPAPDSIGSGLVQFNETVIVTYTGGTSTGGSRQNGRHEHEYSARRVKAACAVEFARRPMLQSTAVPMGVEAVDASGVTLNSVEIILRGDENDQRVLVQTVLTVPLLFQLDPIDFE